MSIETMTKLATVTVGSGGSSTIAFTNIPQTYTDLLLVTSLRSLASGQSASIFFNINSMSGANYRTINIQGTGVVVTSGSTTYAVAGQLNGNGSTASVFSSNSYYFSNYSSNISNKVFSTDSVYESNSTTAGLDLNASSIDTTAPITSIVISDGSSGLAFMQHSTATLYGIRNARRTAGNSVKAIGGNISFDGTYVIHTFNSSGTFTPTAALTVDYLVVAGGGGGGGSAGSTSGAGGAGGLRTSAGTSGGGASAESKLSLIAGNSYICTVGSGGACGTASNNVDGSNGSNSAFWTITSLGGGGGGAGGSGATRNGLSGGSGGGAGNQGTQSLGGSGTANQGYAGGNQAPGNRGGGGGGAGAAGANSTTTLGGAGGIGILSPITNTYFAGGGGGGCNGANGSDSFGPAAGGLGGGGQGGGFGSIVSTAGQVNTGGGGGGGERNGASAGGSGVVIIRYKA